jgi:hypothetical protein
MVYDGNRLPRRGGDLIIPTLEIDSLVFVDPACAAHGKMQIQQAWNGRWTDTPVVFQQGFVPYVQRDLVGAALFCAVLTDDFHLEDFVGLLPGFDLGMGKEGNDSVLKGPESTFDLAFGLGSGCDEMGDTKPAQRTL